MNNEQFDRFTNIKTHGEITTVCRALVASGMDPMALKKAAPKDGNYIAESS